MECIRGAPSSHLRRHTAYIDRLQRLGYGRSFDTELEFWLYRRSAYYPRYSVPGVSEDYTWKLLDLRDKFLESARGYLDFDKMVPKAVVSGHWYHPSPVVSNYCSWPSDFAIRDYLVRKYDEVKVVKIKRLLDVCNSFVVELATITEAAQLPNYATLQGAATDSTWLSPSLNWVHSFLDRTREDLLAAEGPWQRSFCHRHSFVLDTTRGVRDPGGSIITPTDAFSGKPLAETRDGFTWTWHRISLV